MPITSNTKDKASAQLSLGNLLMNTSGPTLPMENTIEVWRPIPGFETIYFASSFGKIKRVESFVRCCNWKRRVRERILRPSKRKYLIIVLSNDGVDYSKTVHGIVAKLFVPNPENKPCVNHKDGDKYNNIWTNLEWVTYQENTDHAILLGWNNKGSLHPMAKLNESDVVKVRQMYYGGENIKNISTYFSVHRETISAIISGRTWGHVL